MKALTITFLILSTNWLAILNAKEFMRCELCKELIQKYNFNKTLLSSWICMIEHESGRDTSKVTRKPNNSSNYGIFQISSKDWCTVGRKGGICNVKCEDLLGDNIAESVACARKIHSREGFRHWKGWERSCRKPEDLPNLVVICGINDMK